MKEKYRKRKKEPRNKLWITKLLFSIIFILVSLIYIEVSTDNKNLYQDKILNNNIKFSTFNKIYNKFFNHHFEEESPKEILTFNDRIEYKSKEKYNNSFKLEVDKEYMIPVITSGIIVYIGDKDDLGNTIIVQGNDGVDVWYSNILSTNYSLYDYVSKGDTIGVTNDEYLYLTFDKDGKYLTYEEYVK